MTVSVAQIMREVRNYFPCERIHGEWTLAGGVLSGSDALRPGDWIAVLGSEYNNGVYQLDAAASLPRGVDEEWTGDIVRLAPPSDFLALCEEIAAWAQHHSPDSALRESFGAYSVTRAASPDGRPLGWQSVFAADLAPYRRMYGEVSL